MSLARKDMPVSLARVLSPLRLSVLAFAGFILLGAAVLMLPFSSSGPPIGFVDALFTATSAACVTGLTVLDTGRDLSRMGQVVVLALIQVGGLGIMTMSTVWLLMAGKRPSLGARLVVQDAFTHRGDRDVRSMILDVVRFTLVLELCGAGLLLARLVGLYPLGEAVFLSLFHSVSAFCNAGFSTFSNNLEDFAGDALVSLTVAFLIISGGIGFLVLREIKFLLWRKAGGRQCLSLHSRLVLVTSGALIGLGTILVLLMEWDNTLAHLSLWEKLLASFFQAVTPRTAGFNTVPIGSMANQTLMVVLLLMFIGASSGSTGGGIKTGTFATLVAMGFSRLRGYPEPKAFGRTISPGSVARAMSVTMVCASVVLVATLLLQVTEVGSSSSAVARGRFLELLFEVVSAFGTVGLSTGITPGLTDAGKLLLTLVMFLGRLGPLVVAVAVARQRTVRFRFAEESIMIG